VSSHTPGNYGAETALAALEGFEPVRVDFEPVCWHHLEATSHANISETVRTIFRRYLDLSGCLRM